MQQDETPLVMGQEVSVTLSSSNPRTVLQAAVGLVLGLIGFFACLGLMSASTPPNLWLFPAAFVCMALAIGWVFFILSRNKPAATPDEPPMTGQPVIQPRRRWLPWAILGGVALVGLVAFIISLGPINRMCRGMIDATATLPETISVGSCHAEVNQTSSLRSFTAQTTLPEATAFLAAYGLPFDPAQTAGDFTMTWNRPGEQVQVGWQDGTLRFDQTLSDSLN